MEIGCRASVASSGQATAQCNRDLGNDLVNGVPASVCVSRSIESCVLSDVALRPAGVAVRAEWCHAISQRCPSLRFREAAFGD